MIKNISKNYRRNIKITSFIITFILVISRIFILAEAQAIPSGIPVSELEQFIDGYASEYIGSTTAAAVVAIVKDGELIFNKAYGDAIQGEVKAGEASVFEWGSAAKLLIWVSVMQLYEQGLLDLDADIRQYLPDNFLKKIKYDTPITMYNLMHHNAGWEDRFIDLFYNSPDAVPSLLESLLVYEPKQIYQPGDVMAYSNYGTALAAYIVERISGQLFYQYAWENIFTPLGMKDTAIHPTQEDNPSVAEKRLKIKGHVLTANGLVPSGSERVYIGMYPAGSAVGTSADAAKFMSALMPPEGENSLLFNDRATLDKMLATSFTYDYNFPGNAHGFWESFYSVRTVGHGGNTDSFSALFTIAPETGFGVVIMANQAGETAMCYRLTGELFGKYIPPHSNPDDFADPNELAGIYTMARGFKSGFMQLITTNLFIFTPVGENTISMAGIEFEQISPYVFQNTRNLNLLDSLDLIYFEAENGEVAFASAMMTDFHLISADYVAKLAGLLLIIVCAVYLIVALLIIIIGFIRNKRKKIASNKAKKLNVALFLSMVAILINNVILFSRAMSYASYASLTIHFIINIAFIIFTPVCTVLLFVNRKNEPSKASKVFNAFTCIFSLILAVILAAGEFWR